MKRIWLLTLWSAVAACSPQIRVFSDFDPAFDLRTFNTFDWQQSTNVEQGRNPLHYNELYDKRIKAAVRHELENRRYTFCDLAPELVIHYHVIVDDQSIVAADPFGDQYGPYWTNMRTTVQSYREGTLIIDVMDAATNNLIWRGWAVSEITNGYNGEETEKLISDVVSMIFRKFPATSYRVIDEKNRKSVCHEN